MSSADFSVVIPNYNDARYLPRCLGAMLNQSVLPREIIVLDDASTDESVSVVQALARRSPLIRLVRNQRNLGCCATINRGAELSEGQFLFLGAADDFVLPGFVEKLVGALQRHPGAALACGFPSAIMEGSGWLRLKPVFWSTAPAYLDPEEFAQRVGHRSPAGHTTVWRRQAFLSVGGLLPDLEWLSDWFATLVAGFRQGICFVPEALALFTIRRDSYSAAARRERERVRRVLGAVLNRLASAEFRDVVDAFARSGAMAVCGPELAHVAAQRSDGRDPLIQSLVAALEGGYSEKRPENTVLAPVRLLARKVSANAAVWLRRRTWRAWRAARRGYRAVCHQSELSRRSA